MRRIGRDRGEAADLSRKAAASGAASNQAELQLVAAEAREANELIDQRTFSWTELFNQLEATLPADVMLVSVRPSSRMAASSSRWRSRARRTEDIVDFFDRLEKTGDFRNVTWQRRAPDRRKALQRMHDDRGVRAEGAEARSMTLVAADLRARSGASSGRSSSLAVANVVAYRGRRVPARPRRWRPASASSSAAQRRAARRTRRLPDGARHGRGQAGRRTRRCGSSTATCCRRTASAAQRVTYLRLAQLAQAANVQLERGANGIKTAEEQLAGRSSSTTYRAVGRLRDVRQFIYSLETAPEFIVLEDVSLASGGVDAGETLSVQIDVSTYFRADDGS